MAWNWDAPPGASRTRATARKLVISFLVGALSLGVAWAGTGLVPVADLDNTKSNTTGGGGWLQDALDQEGEAQAAAAPASLASGQILAGAAYVSTRPDPEAYGGNWIHAEYGPDATEEEKQAARDDAKEQCEIPNSFRDNATHILGDARVRMPENPDCLYMGGYGLGPVNSIVDWDDTYGMGIRSVAIGDGQDVLVLTIVDGVYYFGTYNSFCNGEPAVGPNRGDQDCGFFDLQKSLGEELGLDPSSFMFSSTHSHTSPDFIGAWGGVPDWYMQQIEDSIRASVRGAVASMQPALLEAGEEIVRARNSERRDFYHSAEEAGLVWLRAIDADNQPAPETCVTPSPTPEDGNKGNGEGNGFGNQGKETPPPPTPICEPAAPGQAIFTVGAYAAHPVTADESTGIGDGDFPPVFNKRVEEAFGGVGAFFQTGFGNVSPRGDKIEMGEGLAASVPAIGTGTPITGADGSTPDVRSNQAFFNQTVTNTVLGAGGMSGIFDRPMDGPPGVVRAGENDNKPCTSASAIAVRTAVSAAKVGDVVITGGPGEIFSNYSNTIKEKNPNGFSLPLALVNDGLGYIMESFETDHLGRQGLGFVGEVVEYEDAYSIDHCFGDNALQHTLSLLGQL